MPTMISDVVASGLIVADGYVLALEGLVERGLTLRLYVQAPRARPRIPDPSDTFDSYDEADALGYLPVRLAADAWTILPEGDGASAVHPEVEFTFQAGGAVIGGYLITAGSRLYAVQPLPDPFEVLRRGDALAVQPTILLGPP